MALIESALPLLINGVSQQSPKIRLPSQAEEQLNAIADPVEGLRPRPGTRLKAALDSSEFYYETAAYHLMDRGPNERHLLVISDGTIKVYDLNTGNPVSVSGGTSYLTTTGVFGTDRDSFRFLTVADYTFIVNKEKVVSSETAVLPRNLNRMAMVNVKIGDYGVEYKLRFKINGTEFTAEYTTDNPVTTTTSGTSEQNRDAIDTKTIVQGLVTDLNTKLEASYGGPGVSLGTTDGFNSISFSGPPQLSLIYGANWIAVESATHDLENFIIEDSQGDKAMSLAWKEAKKVTDLPAQGPTGWVAKIGGQGDEVSDDYYVRYDGSNWKETSYEEIRLVQDSMPQALQWNGTTFSLQPVVWANRKAGDDDTNPPPSFVTQRLTDVFFFKDRLGFLAGENIIMSEVGEYFNFFRTTVLQILDSDPIDVGVNEEKMSGLFGAIAFDEKLIAFSRNSQFIVKGEPTLTPETVQADVSTRFEMSPQIRPQGLGRSIYYVQPFGGLGKVREFFIEADSDSIDSADTTGHCPRYIEGNITHLAVSQAHDLVAVKTDAEDRKDSLWVYNFIWQGEEKVQSSWSRWNFPGFEVKWFGFLETRFWFVLEHVDSGSILLEYMDVSQTENWSGNGVVNTFAMDHHKVSMASPSSSYFTSSNSNGRFIFEENTFRFLDEEPAHPGPFHVGYPIQFSYTFSEFQLPSPSRGRDIASVRLGMHMKTFSIHYTDTHSFNIEVKHKGRPLVTKDVKTKTINTELGVSDFPRRDGVFTCLIPGRPQDLTITLKNNSIFPCAFQQAEWEAEAQNRTRRL